MTVEVVGSDGTRLRVHEWGERDRPTILLVHGFPDDHTVWSPVAAQLAKSFHVVAPDVRGSGGSDRPRRLTAYRLDQLACDIGAVLDAVAPDKRVHVVGHDWGAVQAWHAACTPSAEHRFASLTSISGGCLDHVPGWVLTQFRTGREGRRAVATMWKSPFYMGFLQTPVVADLACRLGLVDAVIEWAARFETGTRPTDMPRHRARDNRHGLKIYTANLLPRLLRPRPAPTRVPVQTLVPRGDAFVTPATATVGAPWASSHTVREIDGGHWVAAFDPAPVADAIADFVRRSDTSAAPERSIR
ncbi:Soluble epoxide hydrolase [Nocardia farcinica]|uniref:Soluble epoxide hydrolase n=1 Tax=Nocardia farcinica TaxID=37329 RepID=A0A449GZF6_NOCFR|nr:alpha/beta fold hydrolase [Nocardia farcinica]VFA91137.1 Soluble epoxide hydrolase [Nocardia farcinica]